jgi:hypothetical protein
LTSAQGLPSSAVRVFSLGAFLLLSVVLLSVVLLSVVLLSVVLLSGGAIRLSY